MRFIYTVIFYLALPFILLRLWRRSRAVPAYAERWGERFGFFEPLVTSKKVIWLHTVSVGEFLAALPLIRRLQANTELQLVITTTTPTGSERVRSALSVAGKSGVFHVYAPYDLPEVLYRFLQRIKPALFISMETELWPNTLAACAKRSIPCVLINARLSEKSARGYAKLSGLTKPMLQRLSCAAIQHKADAERFIALGLPVENAQVTGNIKFDLTIDDGLRERAALLKRELSEHGRRLVWIAASTHQGEDEIILDAFARMRATGSTQVQASFLVLVPRHPERFDAVAQLCEARGFRVARRASGESTTGKDILLGNTMGEMMLLFGASDIAFMGGSLVPNGGHNFIEPAAWQLPLLSGEHLFNFAEVARLLSVAGALRLVTNADDLAQALQGLIDDEALRLSVGAAAAQVARDNRGALEKTLKIIERFLTAPH